MVNIRVILLYAIIGTISISCTNYYRTNLGGIWPKKLNFNKVDSLGHESEVKLDVVYKLHSRWWGEYSFESRKKQYYEKVENISQYHKSVPYLRFFGNGNFNVGLLPLNEDVSKNNFNPKKGTIGKYLVDEGTIKLDHFWRVETNGKYVKGKAMIYGDTLHVIERVLPSQIIHKIFIIQEIPDGFLDWDANW